MTRASLAVSLVLAVGFAGSGAIAQTIDGGAYFTPITDNVQPLIHGNLFSKSYLEKRGGKAGPSRKQDVQRAEYYARADASARAGQGIPDLSVRFDRAVSNAVRDEYLASIARASGDRAAQGLRGYYASNDVRALLGSAVRPYGFGTDDLADVTTAYLLVMWMTANDAALPTVAEARGVQAQIHDAFASGAAIPPPANARQRAAESMMYQTVTLIRVREEAQKQRNTAYLVQLADSAQASMARQSFDLRALELTPAGLVPR